MASVVGSGPATRVTFDYQIFSGQAYGGISRYVCELAARVARMESFRVRVVAPLFTNRYLRGSDVAKVGVFVPDIARTNRLRFALSRAAAPALTSLTRPHVVHETYYSRRRVAPRGPAVVLTVHDMIHERMAHMFPPDDFTSALKKQAVARADHIICISERTRADLIEILDVEPSKTSVIYHGCDFGRLAIDPIAPIPDRPFVLYVGDRIGYKNFAALVEAFRASPWSRDLCLVAFGHLPFTAEEVELFGELDVRHIRGDDGVLAALYAAAEVFVYPSLYEGFGIPILEAMTLGCPVVCSKAASIPEVAGDAAEYFDPQSIEDMRKAIDKVLSSSACRAVLRERGYQRAALFKWDRTAEETARIYARLAGH